MLVITVMGLPFRPEMADGIDKVTWEGESLSSVTSPTNSRTRRERNYAAKLRSQDIHCLQNPYRKIMWDDQNLEIVAVKFE